MGGKGAGWSGSMRRGRERLADGAGRDALGPRGKRDKTETSSRASRKRKRASDRGECTYVDLHVLVQVVRQNEMVRHGEPMGLHRMVVAVVRGTHVRIVEVADAVLRGCHRGGERVLGSQAPLAMRTCLRARRVVPNARQCENPGGNEFALHTPRSWARSLEHQLRSGAPQGWLSRDTVLNLLHLRHHIER